MDNLSFLAGAAQTDITPATGTLINGDFVCHIAQTIHDPLYAKAIVMQQGTTLVVIVVADICAMPKDLLDEVRMAVSEATGIPTGHIMIASTHTHFSGSVTDIFLGTTDTSYRSRLPELIVAAAVMAKRNLRPARIALGKVHAPEHVVCRRYTMREEYIATNPVNGGADGVKTNPLGDEDKIISRAGATDPELSYLAIKGTDNKWIALLGNYSMHYVGDSEPGTITADYFGVFASAIRGRLNAGNDFVGILSNGTSGDANIWDFMAPQRYPSGNFVKSELIGNDLAAKVALSLKSLTWDAAPLLAADYRELPMFVRKPSSTELHTAKQLAATTDYSNLQPDACGLRLIYAREQVLLYEYPDEILFPLQVIRIGDGIIGGLGGEFFAETGLWLKYNNPTDHYFTIGLANGYTGYVPPAHEMERGGYETWRCRTSHLERGAEKMVREEMMEMMMKICPL
ncbi:MAG TPA: hypothetical protein VM802_02455 [Chitinophaga sp.]|uniref:hypothetical protein n=1 Tax=Chitinophaga sp. TaxID=1869181 RepID=UPI002C2B0A7D|nr:hypothetical protein [Chitinophaga sp.]HVI43697.1 hypothetical protein [Chitinophaga sp.]